MRDEHPDAIAAVRRRRRWILLLMLIAMILAGRRVGLAFLEGYQAARTVLRLQDEVRAKEAEQARLTARLDALATPSGVEGEVRRRRGHVRPRQRVFYFEGYETAREALEPLVRGRPRSEDAFEVLMYWWQAPNHSAAE